MTARPRETLAFLLCAFGLLAALAALNVWAYYGHLSELPVPPATPMATRVLPRAADRVVVFVIDGLREDVASDATLMPQLNRIAAQGARGVAITPEMTLTTISVIDLATGQTPGISWSIKNFDAEPFEDESVPEIVAKSGYPVALIGDASWTQLFGRWAKTTFSVLDEGFMAKAGHDLSPTDAEILAQGARALEDPEHRLVVIHVVGVDKTAHRDGAVLTRADGSPSSYAQAARAIDAELGRLWDSHGEGAAWLIHSDHGVTLAGTHGGGEPDTRRAPFVWVGPGIARGAAAEISLNQVAATIAGLLGCRAPRVAEAAPPWELLTLGAPERAALSAAHEQARVDFARAMLGPQGHALTASTDRATLSAVGEALDAHSSRTRRLPRWMIWVFGLAAQLAGAFALAAAGAQPLRRALPGAVAWATLCFGLVAAGFWHFPAIKLLGEWRLDDLGGTALRVGGSAALMAAFATLLARIERLPRAWREVAPWALWGAAVLTFHLSALRWPYGPVPEMLRNAMLCGALMWLLRRERSAQPEAYPQGRRGLGLLALGLVAATYAAASAWIGTDHDGHAVASERNPAAAGCWLAVFLATCGLLAHRAAPGRTRVRVFVAAVGLGALALVARHSSDPAWMRVFLPVVAAALLTIAALREVPGPARSAALAVIALALVRALADDARAGVVALFCGAWLAAAPLFRLRATAGLASVVGCFLVSELSLFSQLGYRFSFAALDVRVAFAATRDAVNLGEGFVLLMLQHWAPWLVGAAVLVHHQLTRAELARATVGVLWCMSAAVWCATDGLERHAADHWFTMHAVPMALFRLCSAVLAGGALLLAMASPHAPPPAPLPLPEETTPAAS